MKSVFELTAFDTKLNAYIDRRFYSSRKAAHSSFIELQKHLVQKNDLQNYATTVWTFTDGGDNRTEIVGHINFTLVKWSIQYKPLVF